jgi:hypothetical protein
MRYFKVAGAVKPFLQRLVEGTPEIREAIVATRKGTPVLNWPMQSFFRASATAAAIPSLVKAGDISSGKAKIRGYDCSVAPNSERTLLVVSIQKAYFLIVHVAQGADMRHVSSSIARVIDDIADVLLGEGQGRGPV